MTRSISNSPGTVVPCPMDPPSTISLMLKLSRSYLKVYNVKGMQGWAVEGVIWLLLLWFNSTHVDVPHKFIHCFPGFSQIYLILSFSLTDSCRLNPSVGHSQLNGWSHMLTHTHKVMGLWQQSSLYILCLVEGMGATLSWEIGLCVKFLVATYHCVLQSWL